MFQFVLALMLLAVHPEDFQLLGVCNEPSEVIQYYQAQQYIPDEMYEKLSYHGWKLKFIDNINEVYPHAIGYYNTQLKEVYVDDEKIKGIDCNKDSTIQSTIVHEFVHAYDYEQEYPSEMMNNPEGIDHTELFAYNMTDWLFGKEVEEEYAEFFKSIIE